MADKAAASAGLIALALLVLVQMLAPPLWRTRTLDLLLAMEASLGRGSAPAPTFDIVVVDIDRASLEAVGPWPWPRLTMAKLVQAVADAKPAALGIDILFAGDDQRSPAALARQLADLSGRADLKELAAGLPDGDRMLAQAIAAAPTVLGFVLDPEGDDRLPGPTFLTVGRLRLGGLWRSGGAVGPAASLQEAALGLGALSLPGEDDGRVRQVPLLVAAGPVVLPGLALETLRLASRSAFYRLIAGADPQTAILDMDGRRLTLPPSGALRLTPAMDDGRIRTIRAGDVLRGNPSGLKDSLVLIGGSAPELGGLRATPFDPLTPSVQIQARAVAQLLSGRMLLDAPNQAWLERSGSLVLGILAILAAVRLGPIPGLLVLALAGLAWSGGVLFVLHRQDRMLDPAGPVLVAAAVFAVTAFTSFVLTRKREQLLRERFGQRLHPAVVERLARRPDRLKLAGERRHVTVLVSDLEDFTALTHRMSPQDLILLLDRYLDGIARIVVDHGGMIDKLVGDAVHAIFNAPIDLPNHPLCALNAAEAIVAWTEEFRREPAAASWAFGRTRIGLESGMVIVGDVGLGTRLDYTAYGDAMNLATRLESLNKRFGTSILVGPQAAGALPPSRLRPLGAAAVRGRDAPVELFTTGKPA